MSERQLGVEDSGTPISRLAGCHWDAIRENGVPGMAAKQN